MAAFRKRLDREAFNTLVRRYMERALAVARCLLGRGLSAEDAAQEAFLLVVRHRRRYRPGKPFAPWFHTILRNVCRGMRRGRSRQAKLLAAAAARRQQQGVARPPELPSLAELLADLDADDRTVLLLRVVEGMAFEEIAAAMGISREAAKKRGQRALRRLRDSSTVRLWYGGASRILPTGASPDGEDRNTEGQE